MPLSLLNHSALALFAQRTRIPTSARSIGFCAIWVCISSSSSSSFLAASKPEKSGRYKRPFGARRAIIRERYFPFCIEFELIQTQMTQKPMLRAEAYARALRASQNRKEDGV